MILIRIILNVLPEKQKEVMQTLLSINEPTEVENGYLSYDIFCDIEDKNVFNLISETETRQHLDHHMRSDRFSVLLGTKSLLRESIENSGFYGLRCRRDEGCRVRTKKSKQCFPH